MIELGRADDRRIQDGAVGDLDAVALKMLVHRSQQRLAGPVLLEQVAELADRRLVRRTSVDSWHSSSAVRCSVDAKGEGRCHRARNGLTMRRHAAADGAKG